MALKAHLDNPAGGSLRANERRKLLLETSGAMASGEAANVTVHNVSQTGMLLETTLGLVEGETLEVDLPEAGLVPMRVVWNSGLLFGCQFKGPITSGALSAAELRSAAPLPPMLGQGAQGRKLGGEAFGKQLEQLRKGKGMTLAEVADRLGVSKPTVWAWEKGKARPIDERLPALAEALGVDPGLLVQADEPPGLAELVESSRQRIADAYGTSADRVRIMIEV